MTEEIKQLFKEYVKTHSPQECAELQGNLTAMMLIKASNNPKWVFK